MPRSLLVPLSAAIALLAAAPDVSARATRAASADPSTCDGIADYADELRPGKHRFVGETRVEAGLTEVAITLDLRKRVAAPFRAASARPDPASFEPGAANGDLGIRSASVRPARFPAIRAGQKTVSSSAPLVLRLPAENVPQLRRRLITRQLPLLVHADEKRVLQPGVRIERWRSSAVLAFATGLEAHAVGNTEALESRPPYDAEAEYVLELASEGDNPDVDGFFRGIGRNERVYLTPGADPLDALPASIHYAQVIEAVYDDSYVIGPERLGTAWYVRVRRTDLESIPEIYASGSFCTPPANPHPRGRDSVSRPVRFHDVPFAGGAVTLSGRAHGHELKPVLEIRVRPNGVRTTASLDTSLRLKVQLRAHASRSVNATIPLYDLCIPLEGLPVGPVNVPLNLQLEHNLQVQGTVVAGAVTAFNEHVDAGYAAGYDSRLADAAWFSGPRQVALHPPAGPPRRADGSGTDVTIDSNARATLHLGAGYPSCDGGFGTFANAPSTRDRSASRFAGFRIARVRALEYLPGIMKDAIPLTDLIHQAQAGDEAALGAVFDVAYQDLHDLARRRLSRGGRGSVLGTTSLVHESFLRFADAGRVRIEDRQHFLRYAAHVMRSVVVDLVRQNLSERRGGQARHVTLTTDAGGAVARGEAEILRVHEALQALAEVDERLVKVVEMRYFAGMTQPEVAEVLGVTERTVRRDWEKARVLLADALS